MDVTVCVGITFVVMGGGVSSVSVVVSGVEKILQVSPTAEPSISGASKSNGEDKDRANGHKLEVC